MGDKLSRGKDNLKIEPLTKFMFANFPYSNKYGFPEVVKQSINVVDLIGFNYVLNTKPKGQTVHFFLDDYQFERVWNRPETYLNRLAGFNGVLGTDFSLYRYEPMAVQIFNTFKNRWLAAYWQKNGLQVIPTVAWSDERSFEWCFDGIPEGCHVAVSSVGVLMTPGTIDYFRVGYAAMMERIRPERVYFYGPKIDDLDGDIQFFEARKFGKMEV